MKRMTFANGVGEKLHIDLRNERGGVWSIENKYGSAREGGDIEVVWMSDDGAEFVFRPVWNNMTKRLIMKEETILMIARSYILVGAREKFSR